jgi:H+-transporting ATPase
MLRKHPVRALLRLLRCALQDDCPTYVPGYDQGSLLLMAALAAKWREPPRDALDTLVLGSADLAAIEQHQQLEYMPFDPMTKRTQGTIK